MTTTATSFEHLYKQEFQNLKLGKWVIDPKWIREFREQSINTFIKLGFPKGGRGNESWKYTDVRQIAKVPFKAASPHRHELLPDSEVESVAFAGSRWSRLVFIDGNYAPQFSSNVATQYNVVLANIAEVMHTHPDLLKAHLAQYANHEEEAFIALNAAFVHDGAFIYVPDDTEIEGPIQILFLSSSQVEAVASHPRLLVVVGKRSKVNILETYAGLGGGPAFTNSVAEYAIGENSSVHRYRLQREANQTFHIATTQVDCSIGARFDSVTMDIGSKLARHNLNIKMSGERSQCHLGGLYSVDEDQHLDNQTFVDHAAARTSSYQLYKGIASGASRSVFNGRILVRKGSQQVEASQTNKNLTLSNKAEIDSKPQLEIFDDDVKCKHGAAIGQIDQNALFYMKSRGLDEKSAKSLLMSGFLSEVIESIAHVPVRALMDSVIQAKLSWES